MHQALNWIAQDCSQGRLDAMHFPWERLRYEHTQAIRATLADRYAAATANKMLSALRGVLKECWRLGRIDAEALARASDLPAVKGTREPKGRALSEDEVVALLSNAGDLRNRRLLSLMVRTGLRREEAASLLWGDVFPDRFIVHGKGNKTRAIPITKTVDNIFKNQREWVGLQPPYERVFGVSASRVWQIVREASIRGRLSAVATPHDLRRTFATRMIDAGVDLPTVQRLMGHSDPKTTAGYDRRGLDEARAAMERANG